MRTKESKNDKRTKLPNVDIYGFLVSMDLSFLMIKQFSFVIGGVCVMCYFSWLGNQRKSQQLKVLCLWISLTPLSPQS